MRAPAAIALLFSSTAAGASLADEGNRPSLLTPIAPIAIGADDDAPRSPTFGVAGTARFVAGIRGAQDFEENTDVSLFAQQTWFVVDDVEIGAELAGWWIFQDDDTWGVASSLVVRYHFYQQPTWSVYAEGGIGLFIAADNVPDDGTSFGLMPRIGVGTSMRIDDRDTRLMLGIHWHHISNARLNGEARNPARDAVGLYAAIAVPI
ncbi:MAG: acyloxyacyl hydrolase [Planctomycetota bacterium]